MQADLLQATTLLNELSLFSMAQLLESEREKDLRKKSDEGSWQSSKQCSVEGVRGEEQEEMLQILDGLSEVQSPDAIRCRIDMVDCFGSAQRNRELLFKRHRTHQERELLARHALIEQQFPFREAGGSMTDNSIKSGSDRNHCQKRAKKELIFKSNCKKVQRVSFWSQDIEKLNPTGDLNDNIIENYFKMLRSSALPLEIEETIHIFSTHFLTRLLGQNFTFELDGPRKEVEKIKKKVAENYIQIKRWTKNVDIFTKKLVIFPINAFNHWFSIIVRYPKCLLNQSRETAEIIYCDSMLEKRDLVIEAIKAYLARQLLEKKNIKESSIDSVKVYQLLLPRQLNTHDCGLYMITYIDELLSNQDCLRNLHIPRNRNKLRLFPRKLIFTSRQRLIRLIKKLPYQGTQTASDQILQQFWKQKRQILMNANDYDTIDQKQFEKYKSLKLIFPKELELPPEEIQHCQLIRFYLDSEVNHYQKDIKDVRM